jgi:hypothetical protein
MAARVDMKEISLSRAEIEAYLVLILALETLCLINLESLRKTFHANKQFDNLREYNDLIFIMEIMAELHEEMVFKNIFQYYKENRDQEIAFQEKLLFEKMKEYQDANNFRMYNETQLALLKLMQEDYTKVLNDLKGLKNILTMKLAEVDIKINRLDNLVKDMGSKAQSSFHEAVSNLINNSPATSHFKINDIVIDYDPKEIWQRFIEAYKGRFEEENITSADITEEFEKIINDYVQEKIKNHPEIANFSPEVIKTVVSEAATNYKNQFDADPAAAAFYNFLDRKKEYSEERTVQLGIKNEIVNKIEQADQAMEKVISAEQLAVKESGKVERLHSLAKTLEATNEFVNEFRGLVLISDNERDVNVAEEIKSFAIDDEEENFELDASPVISDVASAQKLEFEIDENEEEFPIEEDIRIASPVDKPILEDNEEPRLSPGGVPVSQINSAEKPIKASQIQQLLMGKAAADILAKAEQEKLNNPQVNVNASIPASKNASGVQQNNKSSEENKKVEDEHKVDDVKKPRGPR